MSSATGMDAMLASSADSVMCICDVLDERRAEASRLGVQLLAKLSLFSARGYAAAVQVGLRTILAVQTEREFCMRLCAIHPAAVLSAHLLFL